MYNQIKKNVSQCLENYFQWKYFNFGFGTCIETIFSIVTNKVILIAMHGSNGTVHTRKKKFYVLI